MPETTDLVDAVQALESDADGGPITVVIDPHHIDALVEHGRAAVWGTSDQHDDAVTANIVVDRED